MSDAPRSLLPRVEELLTSRGLEKRELAAALGMSRQTLWRRLTHPEKLRAREIDVVARFLQVDRSELLGELVGGQWEPEPERDEAHGGEEPPESPAGAQLEEFMSNMDRIVHFLSNSTGGEITQAVKIGLLNGIEQVARETGNKLPPEYGEIRRRVVNGEL